LRLSGASFANVRAELIKARSALSGSLLAYAVSLRPACFRGGEVAHGAFGSSPVNVTQPGQLRDRDTARMGRRKFAGLRVPYRAELEIEPRTDASRRGFAPATEQLESQESLQAFKVYRIISLFEYPRQAGTKLTAQSIRKRRLRRWRPAPFHFPRQRFRFHPSLFLSSRLKKQEAIASVRSLPPQAE